MRGRERIHGLRFRFSSWFGGRKRGAVTQYITLEALELARSRTQFIDALARTALGNMIIQLKPFDGMEFKRTRKVVLYRNPASIEETMDWPDWCRRYYTREATYRFDVDLSIHVGEIR